MAIRLAAQNQLADLSRQYRSKGLLPVTIRILLWQFSQKVVSRADATPAVVGTISSDLDLAMNATYFRDYQGLTPMFVRDRLRFFR